MSAESEQIFELDSGLLRAEIEKSAKNAYEYDNALRRRAFLDGSDATILGETSDENTPGANLVRFAIVPEISFDAEAVKPIETELSMFDIDERSDLWGVRQSSRKFILSLESLSKQMRGIGYPGSSLNINPEKVLFSHNASDCSLPVDIGEQVVREMYIYPSPILDGSSAIEGFVEYLSQNPQNGVDLETVRNELYQLNPRNTDFERRVQVLFYPNLAVSSLSLELTKYIAIMTYNSALRLAERDNQAISIAATTALPNGAKVKHYNEENGLSVPIVGY